MEEGLVVGMGGVWGRGLEVGAVAGILEGPLPPRSPAPLPPPPFYLQTP